jgi:hypothetical protein
MHEIPTLKKNIERYSSESKAVESTLETSKTINSAQSSTIEKHVATIRTLEAAAETLNSLTKNQSNEIGKKSDDLCFHLILCLYTHKQTLPLSLLPHASTSLPSALSLNVILPPSFNFHFFRKTARYYKNTAQS